MRTELRVPLEGVGGQAVRTAIGTEGAQGEKVRGVLRANRARRYARSRSVRTSKRPRPAGCRCLFRAEAQGPGAVRGRSSYGRGRAGPATAGADRSESLKPPNGPVEQGSWSQHRGPSGTRRRARSAARVSAVLPEEPYRVRTCRRTGGRRR
ncbi:hypothetical protein STPH1_1095 [Streptomyces sp. OM5714]|nr:hypothetical protein STPH1_1095 [Streptomyces sp. OM5714]